MILRSERNSDQWFTPELEITAEGSYKSIYGDPLDSPKDRIRKEINEIIFSKSDYIGTST